MLCGLCSWKRRRIAVCVALTVVISVSMFFAWCTVYTPYAREYHYFSHLSSYKLTQLSWPFYIVDWTSIWGAGDVAFFFLDRSHPIVERYSASQQGYWTNWSWNDRVNQEFVFWLAIINITGGVLGLMSSWAIISPPASKIRAFPKELTLASLTLLGIGLALILLGNLTFAESNELDYPDGITTPEAHAWLKSVRDSWNGQAALEIVLGISAFIGSILLGVVGRFMNKWHVITVILATVVVAQGFLYVSQKANYEVLDTAYQQLSARTNNEKNKMEADLWSAGSKLRAVQSDYDSLRSSYNSYMSSYSNMRARINSKYPYTYVRDFITPTDTTVKNKVVEISGGWSNTSDWNEYWDDVKKIYDWVVSNVDYRSDGFYPVIPTEPFGNLEYLEEMRQFPSETLTLLQGGCEDMALLLTSLILSYNGGKPQTECIVLDGSKGSHIGVQLLVSEDRLTILDPAGDYYTQTSGNIDQKDISTEIGNWLDYWKPVIGSDVHVDRVFSDDLDKFFSSTFEYTSWMYSR